MSCAAYSGEEHAALDPLSVFYKKILIVCIQSLDAEAVIDLHKFSKPRFLARVGNHAIRRGDDLSSIRGTDIDAFVHFKFA